MSHISRVSDALTSLLPLTSNYPATQPLTWPILTALTELRRPEETATHAWQPTAPENNHGSYFRYSSVVTMTMGSNSL
jgi:hypothetical protein